ncbi:MAG TPA: hypothetical protein VK601_12690 [Kofleriaceae bacterium]|nr:hypothetical protein [Kofleriaceae bacterium]
MSSFATCTAGPYLEHPAEALAYYRKEGLDRAICEQKHMGSRAVIVACRDEAAALERFGIAGPGAVYTRTGRPLFGDDATEAAVLARVTAALERSGLWDQLATRWVCLDVELMPWSAKAQDLLRTQYAAVGSAACSALGDAVAALEACAARTGEARALADRYRARADAAGAFVAAYRGYCWPVRSIADLEIAPFHVLASEGAVHADKDHAWRMQVLAQLCAADPELLSPTPHRIVELGNDDSERAAIEWWEELTAAGGEGIVVKPLSWLARGRRGLVQPAIKCRGRATPATIAAAARAAPALARMGTV